LKTTKPFNISQELKLQLSLRIRVHTALNPQPSDYWWTSIKWCDWWLQNSGKLFLPCSTFQRNRPEESMQGFQFSCPPRREESIHERNWLLPREHCQKNL